MEKTTIFFLITFLILIPGRAEANDVPELKFGIGVDITNYLLSGYSLEIAAVLGQTEIEMGFGKFDYPDWMLRDDINSGVSQGVSGYLKYNLGKNVTKLFIGIGVAYLVDEFDYVQSYDNVEGRITLICGTVGYNIKISDHVRLIPSVQAGLIVAGGAEKTIGQWTYSARSYGFGVALGAYYYF